jgi:hypothetical protein
VWFSLAENHENVFRFGHTYCETALAPRLHVFLLWQNPVLQLYGSGPIFMLFGCRISDMNDC